MAQAGGRLSNPPSFTVSRIEKLPDPTTAHVRPVRSKRELLFLPTKSFFEHRPCFRVTLDIRPCGSLQYLCECQSERHNIEFSCPAASNQRHVVLPDCVHRFTRPLRGQLQRLVRFILNKQPPWAYRSSTIKLPFS